MRDQRSSSLLSRAGLGTQDVIALLLVIAVGAASIVFSIASWKHWHDKAIPQVGEVPQLRDLLSDEQRCERGLATIRISLANLKNKTSDLRLKLEDEIKTLPSLLPEPVFAYKPLPWWIKITVIDIISAEHAYYLSQRAAFEIEHGLWKEKKAIVDAANARIDALKIKIAQQVEEAAGLDSRDGKLSSELRTIREQIASQRTPDPPIGPGKWLWNEWIGPLLHLSLTWAAIAFTLNLLFRCVLLRGWIGVGRI